MAVTGTDPTVCIKRFVWAALCESMLLEIHANNAVIVPDVVNRIVVDHDHEIQQG